MNRDEGELALRFQIEFQPINSKQANKHLQKNKKQNSFYAVVLRLFELPSSAGACPVLGARHSDGRFILVFEHAAKAVEAEVVSTAWLRTPSDVPGVFVGGDVV